MLWDTLLSGLVKPRMFGIIIKATLHVFVQLDFLVEKNSSQLGQKWSGPNCGQQGALQSYDVQNLSVSCRVVGLPTWTSDQVWRNSNVLELTLTLSMNRSSSLTDIKSYFCTNKVIPKHVFHDCMLNHPGTEIPKSWFCPSGRRNGVWLKTFALIMLNFMGWCILSVLQNDMDEQYGERYGQRVEDRLLHYLHELDAVLQGDTYIDKVCVHCLTL